ncbi:hypothetical protein AB7W72_22585, partial [Providencia rettgeri]
RQMIIYRLWRMKTPSEKCPNFVVQNILLANVCVHHIANDFLTFITNTSSCFVSEVFKLIST